jgi:hypothetical protein
MTQDQRDTNWKYFRLLGWVLFFMMCFKYCGKETKPIPTKGTFKTDTIIIHKTLPGKTIKIKGKTVTVYKDNEINKELALENYNLQIAYINAKDSLEKEKLYKTAIELKSFSNDFENDNFKANVSGIVQGEVKNMKLDYEIKKMPIEKTKFRMLLGGGITLKAVDLNVGFQNSKGNILEVGYDTEKNIRIGYKQSIFSIKKP